MAGKIFISYRRDDTAASALGICQYLEHSFGRKKLFIDVDMRAGANFPAVLEQRLAECKVMLVLIGRAWLNAVDNQGQNRLQQPDDWVRLEIAHALKRAITVIPVCVNGAELPKKAMLPEDIQGLINHQAASVSTSNFRSDMAGLAKDIGSIPSPRSWRVVGAVVLGLLLIMTGSVWLYWPGLFSRDQSGAHQEPVGNTTQPVSTSNRQQETDWTLYAVSNARYAQFLRLDSIRQLGDRVAVHTRYVVDPSQLKIPDKNFY